MKTILLPLPIQLVNKINGKLLLRQEPEGDKVVFVAIPPYTMATFLEDFVYTDRSLSVDDQGKSRADSRQILKAIDRLRRAFDGVTSGSVQVEDYDYDLVKRVLDRPGTPWPMGQVSQLLPLMDAWDAAK